MEEIKKKKKKYLYFTINSMIDLQKVQTYLQKQVTEGLYANNPNVEYEFFEIKISEEDNHDADENNVSYRDKEITEKRIDSSSSSNTPLLELPPSNTEKEEKKTIMLDMRLLDLIERDTLPNASKYKNINRKILKSELESADKVFILSPIQYIQTYTYFITSSVSSTCEVHYFLSPYEDVEELKELYPTVYNRINVFHLFNIPCEALNIINKNKKRIIENKRVILHRIPWKTILTPLNTLTEKQKEQIREQRKSFFKHISMFGINPFCVSSIKCSNSRVYELLKSVYTTCKDETEYMVLVYNDILTSSKTISDYVLYLFGTNINYMLLTPSYQTLTLQYEKWICELDFANIHIVSDRIGYRGEYAFSIIELFFATQSLIYILKEDKPEVRHNQLEVLLSLAEQLEEQVSEYNKQIKKQNKLNKVKSKRVSHKKEEETLPLENTVQHISPTELEFIKSFIEHFRFLVKKRVVLVENTENNLSNRLKETLSMLKTSKLVEAFKYKNKEKESGSEDYSEGIIEMLTEYGKDYRIDLHTLNTLLNTSFIKESDNKFYKVFLE